MKKDNQASVHKVSEFKPQTNKKFVKKNMTTPHKKPVFRKPPETFYEKGIVSIMGKNLQQMSQSEPL